MLNQHPKKHRHAGTPNVVRDPLVDPGNPSHRYQARSTAHLDRPRSRMVALAASPPGPRSPRSPQAENATVMLRAGEDGMRLYNREQHGSLAFLYGGHDPGVCCRMHSGVALWFLGYPKIALERSSTALALAKELAHIGTTVMQIPLAGMIHQLRGDLDGVRGVAEPLIAIAAEHGFPQWLAFGRVLDTWLQAELGGEATVAQLRCAIDNRDHNPTYVPYFLGLLAAMQLKYGETAEGLATIASALELTGGTGARLWDPELLRLKGELLLASDPRT